MDNEAKLNLMKKRVIGSFKWQEDIIIPFSKEFGCTTEDLEDLFMDLLDMSSLEALHGTLEIANHKCLLERLDADLRLPWYVDVLELLSVEQGDELKNKGDNVVALIAGVNGEKANLVAVCGKEAIAKGVKAGDLVREIAKMAGGGGGGRPDSAMAGAKDISKLDSAISAVEDTVKSLIK